MTDNESNREEAAPNQPLRRATRTSSHSLRRPPEKFRRATLPPTIQEQVEKTPLRRRRRQ